MYKCETCGKLVHDTEKFGSGRFCCKSCANTHKISIEQRIKTSASLKKYVKSHTIDISEYNQKKHIEAVTEYNRNPKYCVICGNILPYRLRKRTTCSDECFHKSLCKAGLHSSSVQSTTRRSKNEIYFYELCEKQFKNVKHNDAIFNGWDADVIIEDIKYAVLWNGPWHYKQIKQGQSVKQIANRDKLKCKEILACGYTPYIIKDLGKYNRKFVEEEFRKLLDKIK